MTEDKKTKVIFWLRQKKQHLKKIGLFLAGWFTVPAITGGWSYDLFGTSEWSEIWYKIAHPGVWLDALTVYTVAFLTFGYLPDRLTKRNAFVKLFYFACYYLVLYKIAGFLFR